MSEEKKLFIAYVACLVLTTIGAALVIYSGDLARSAILSGCVGWLIAKWDDFVP